MNNEPLFTHPELHPNELFVANTSKEKFENLDIPSKRLGERTFDGLGNEFKADNWFPVFADTSECDHEKLASIRQNLKQG